jgi:membrane-associated protein
VIYFLSERVMSFPELVFYSVVGASLGDHAGYWIGRCLGDKPLFWWPLKNRPHLREKMTGWLKQYGAYGLIAGRFFSPVRPVAPVLAAVFGMRYRDFAFANLIACTSWVLAWSILVLLIVHGYWTLNF